MMKATPMTADRNTPSANFRRELEALLNKYSQENGSDSPDFVLAQFLIDSLIAWNGAMGLREAFYGRTVSKHFKLDAAVRK